MGKLQEIVDLTNMIVRVLPSLASQFRKKKIKELIDAVDIGSLISRSHLETVLEEVLRYGEITKAYDTIDEEKIPLFTDFLKKLKTDWQGEVVITAHREKTKLHVTYILLSGKHQPETVSQIIVAHRDDVSMTPLTAPDILQSIGLARQAKQAPSDKILALAQLGHEAITKLK